MKLFVHEKSVIGHAFEAVATLAGTCEVVTSAEEADEVLCIKPHDAIDLLLAGHKVVLVQIGRDDRVGVDALEQNERFKDSLTVFRYTFGDSDGQTMVNLINHFAQ